MNVTEISNHKEVALARLREQYKDLPNLEALLVPMLIQIQELETVFIDLRDKRSIYDSVGAQLDAWGVVLNRARNGLSDSDYRLVLLGEVAVNVSKGTPEDMIQVFRIFTQPTYVSLNEIFPAKLQLTSVGGVPIGSVDDIKDAVRRACPAGVAIDLFTTAPGNPFVFLGDPDPNGRGFGDANDPSVGGFLVSIF